MVAILLIFFIEKSVESNCAFGLVVVDVGKDDILENQGGLVYSCDG